jgi:cyclopropane fatty-acyl-phospholipid synthase-like methyltransferase
MDRKPEKKVKKYYDDNTNLFLKLGKDASTRNIHQALKLYPGMSKKDSMHASNQLVLDAVLDIPETGINVLDLGCGVGSSMVYLAHGVKSPAMFFGVTLSNKQANIAKALFENHGLKQSCKVYEASYLELPVDIPPINLGFAIESFIHTASVPEFFKEVGQKIKKGGKLIIIDDFLNSQTSPELIPNEHRGILENFKKGWLANSLYTREKVISAALKYDLNCIDHIDLTDALDTWRPRDRVIHLFISLFGKLNVPKSYFKFLIGGNARQLAYRNNLLSYHMLVFNKN